MLKRALLLLLLLCWPCYCSAYTITEAELEQLETNLETLDSLKEQSQLELTQLETQLQNSKVKLINLEKQLTELKQTSETQEKLLQTANESLKAYEKETKAKIRKVKVQRNIGYFLAVIAAGIAIGR